MYKFMLLFKCISIVYNLFTTDIEYKSEWECPSESGDYVYLIKINLFLIFLNQ